MRKPEALLDQLKENSFTKNVIMITSGAVFAQAMNIVLTPIITRLYSPDQFGIFTVYTALNGMIYFMGSFSYEDAIPIAKDDEQAFHVLTLCFLILISMTSFHAVLMLVAGDTILTFFKAEEILRYKYWLPLGFFLASLSTILLQWAFRKKNFKSITLTKYSRSITGNSAKISFGLLGAGAIGLMVGHMLSIFAEIFSLTKPNLAEFKQLIKKVDLPTIKRVAIRFKNFPIYSASGLMVLAASSQMPTIFMSSLYGAGVVGLYGLARGITFLPMTIVGKSIQDVFYSEAASIGRSNPARIKELSNKLLKKLILLAALPMIALILFGPQLFSFVFGPEWATAGSFSRILTIEVFFHFIFHPISTVFTIFEEQQKSFALYVFKLFLVLGVFTLARLFQIPSHTTIFIYSILMSVTEMIKYFLAQRILNNEKKRMC